MCTSACRRQDSSGIPRWCACALVILVAAKAFAVEPTDQLEFADALFRRGLYEMAIREYKAVAENPESTNAPLAYFRLGEAYKRLDQMEEANAAYRGAIARDPDHPAALRARLRLAEWQMAVGRWADAERALAALEARADLPSDIAPAVRLLRAQALLKANQPAEAERVYRHLIRDFGATPFAQIARVELANLLANRGADFPEIRALLESAAGQEEIPAAAQAALRFLAEELYRRNDFVGSSEAYMRFFERFPDAPEAETARLPAAWALYKAGRYSEARAFAETLEESASSLYLQANLLRATGLRSEAKDRYRSLLARFPQSSEANTAAYELAVLLFEDKQFADAYQAALCVQPSPSISDDWQWMLSECALELGRPDEAVERFDALAGSTPDRERAVAARFQAARIRRQQQKWEEAAGRFRELADLEPTHPLAAEARYWAGICELRRGALENALREWSRFLAESPAHPLREQVLFARAQAERALERWSDASESLRDFLAAFPFSSRAAEAHLLLGNTLEHLGQPEAAEAQYSQGLHQNPAPEIARNLQFRRLAVLQQLGREEESEQAIHRLVAEGAGADVPVQLLDWAARRSIGRGAYSDALAAARAIVAQPVSEAWTQIGKYLEGRALLGLDQADEAGASFREAALMSEITPEGVESAWRWGEWALAAGRLDEALQAFERAAERAGTTELAEIRARSYLGLGRVYEERSQWSEAARHYLAVGVLYDHSVIVPEALDAAARALEKLGDRRAAERVRAERSARYSDKEP